MDKKREQKIREEIRKKLEQEFRQKQQKKPERDEFDKEELILREKIRKEEEERFYREKGLVRYKNKYGEIEWLLPEEAQRRYNRRKKRKRSLRKKWKVIRGRLLEYAVFALLIILLYSFYKYFQKKSRPVRTVQKIEIKSNVHGAYIFMNGNFMNQYSPTILNGVSPGTHLIQLIKPGYFSMPPFMKVKVGPNESHSLFFNLIPYKKIFTLRMPEELVDGNIYIDGLPVKNGKDKIDITEGLHLMYVEHPDFFMDPARFWIVMDDNKKFSETYSKISKDNVAFISVTSSVPDVNLFLNDNIWGIQPNGLWHPVPAGSYKLNAYYPTLTFSPAEFIFELKSGEKKRIILSPSTKDTVEFVRCRVDYPREFYFLLDGMRLELNRNGELDVITGDHMFTIVTKNGQLVTNHKIFIGGTDYLQLVWDPNLRRFLKNGGQKQ